MFLCLPFLPKHSFAKYWILYSLIYHAIKSRGVRHDALRRCSSPFGIMRIVIDKFYLHTTSETVLTSIRLLLQGLDTWIHYQIIRDMLLASALPKIHAVFAIWVAHAAMNQYFRCSTASVMVHAWYSMTSQRKPAKITTEPIVHTPRNEEGAKEHSTSSKEEDVDTEDESVSSTESSEGLDIEEDFIVRKLLRPGCVPVELEGRQGTATDGVDTAVRIGSVLAILAALFVLGFDTVPFRALSYNLPGMLLAAPAMATTTTVNQSIADVALVWLLGSLLHGIWAIFLKGTSPIHQQQRHATSRVRHRVVIHSVDMILLIATATYVTPACASLCWYLVASVTMKSYLVADPVRRPRLIWRSLQVLEFFGKTLLARQIASLSLPDGRTAWIELHVSVVWALWVVFTPIPTPCEVPRHSEPASVADVVFLGHPAELIDCWALWLLPYSLQERWKGPFWAIPLWPLHWLIGWYVCNYRRKIFGEHASFFCCDDTSYDGIRVQTWTAAHFGRHFVTHPQQVKQNIEAAARHANALGVKVLCLGALNKAESINGGGVGVVRALGGEASLSVIHGNHLTAAAVVETTVQCYGAKSKVFLTGASSKVGWAVAQALRNKYGFAVLCHSTDEGRRKFFEQHGFAAASSLSEGTRFSPLWIVGKYDLDVPKLIPQNATAIVFTVPNCLGARSDVRVVEAGLLHMDTSRLNRPRRFSNKLKSHEMFACHAASLVAVYRLKRDGINRIEETGPVDPDTMDSWLEDAKKLGLWVPRVTLPLKGTKMTPCDKPPVVIVGAGPSGLAVASSLALRDNIPCIVLEAQEDPDQFGSWDHHFAGLEVTSQKKWCNLPGFSMFDNAEFPGETLSADDYRRYLHLYAARFGISIRRGVRASSIDKGDAKVPWTVQVEGGECVSASAVVVATGKNRIPNRTTCKDLADRLIAANILSLHTVDLRDEKSWSQAIDAAKKGRLAIVGFGNSAADVATALLQKCPSTAKIHIAARSVPPVFPRKVSFLRVDTIGYYSVRWLPGLVQDLVVRTLWWGIPSSRICNTAFPSHLRRWEHIGGRVPVIDKDGTIVSGFQSGRLVGHGPVVHVDLQALHFDDHRNAKNEESVGIDMVIFATGYNASCLVSREDNLNGLYMCGFGNDRLLPIQSIGEQAQRIATQIANNF